MLTAALGHAIARLDVPTLVIDLDPANVLGLLLGTGRGPEPGIGAAVAQGRDWADAALMTADNLRYLPFGQTTAAQRAALEARLAHEPGWFAVQLARIELPPEAIVLCDTPRRPSLLADEACRAAVCAIEVLAATPLSYAGLRGQCPARARVHLLNGFDATRSLHTDLRAVLLDELGDTLAPYAVHRDEAVAEALAADRALLDYGSSSQAVRDIHALARWFVHERART